MSIRGFWEAEDPAHLGKEAHGRKAGMDRNREKEIGKTPLEAVER